MSTTISRRSFLKAGVVAGATLALPDFVTRSGQSLTALAARRPPDYTKIVDIYRNKWTWDKTVRGTHMSNGWYQAHCAFGRDHRHFLPYGRTIVVENYVSHAKKLRRSLCSH